MERSEQINELAAALAKAQGAMKAAELDRANPFFKSKYATLASIWTAARGPLSANGLSVAQVPDWTPEGLHLTTVLMHASGQFISSSYPINPVKEDPQGIGSAISYARRYTLAAMIGATSDEDDDGNEASQPARQNNPQRQLTPTEAQQRQTQPPARQPEPHTSEAPRLARIIGNPGFPTYATPFAKDFPRYANKQGVFDTEHIQARAFQLGFAVIDVSNIATVFAKLREHAAEQAALPEA